MGKTQIDLDTRNEVLDFIGRVRVSNNVSLDIRQEAEGIYQALKPQRKRNRKIITEKDNGW